MQFPRIILTVRKHIVPQEALAGAAIGVCVEEALDDGVVISALEVVEACLFDCILPLRTICAGFLVVKNRSKGAAPGGRTPSRKGELSCHTQRTKPSPVLHCFG